MENPHIAHSEEHVISADQKIESRLQKVTEQLKRFSKQKYTQLGLVLLLAVSVPLTVILSMHQQDLRQHAAEIPANEDWQTCPVVPYGSPGTLDVDSAIKGERDFNNRNDPVALFGHYVPSNDPNDPYFTDAAADGEGRWAGDSRRDAGTPYYHGGTYRSDGEGGDGTESVYRVGGFYYLGFQDTNLQDLSGHTESQSNWNTVMRWTEDALTGTGDYSGGIGGWYKDNNPTLDKKGKFINRNCVLQKMVFRLMHSYQDSGKADLFGYNRESGFFIGAEGINTGTASNGTPGSNNTTLSNVINTPADDKNSCKDSTFSDVTAETDKTLATAVACLGMKQYCTVRGFEDGTLRPNDPASRAYVIAFLTRYHVYVMKDWQFVNLSSIPDSSLYTDIPRNYGLALEIYTAREKGLLSKTVTTFKPDDPWMFGFKGANPDDYNFSKTESTMTRGDFIKALYAYGTSGGQLTCTTTSKETTRKDPAPFVENASDKDNRINVCGDKASLLSGYITSQPSIAVFKDALYLFAKGKNDELYVRKLTPSIHPDGTLMDLSTSPWTDLGKQITGDIRTYVQNEEGVPSLSVIIRDKFDTKSYIRSTTGTSWGTWIEFTGALNSQMREDQVLSTNNMTFSFNKGKEDESSENNLCMTISAVPLTGAIQTNPAGSAPPPQTSPAASGNTPASPEDNETLTGEYDTIQACKDANPGATTAECCSKSLKFRDGCPTANDTGMADVTNPKPQNVFQQFWSWLTNLF